ncbi:MAG TPA: siderophore-interacting protein [Nakamurella sp.]
MAVEALERLQLRVLKAAVPLVMASANYRDDWEQFPMTVTAVRTLTEPVRRITFRAPEFGEFIPAVRTSTSRIFPARPGAELVMPNADKVNVRTAVAQIPEAQRPEMRWYTVRALRPEAAEIDVDIVVHGDSGPGSAWALRAVPGDRVGFRASGSCYRTPTGRGPKLFVADETAMPALYSVPESLDSTAGVAALLELPDASYDTPLTADVRPQVVLRGSDAPGSAALTRLAELDLPKQTYAWACGESSLATGVRRHLVKNNLADRRSIMFSGYWKLGQVRV